VSSGLDISGFGDLSYSAQYDILFRQLDQVDLKKAVPKPSFTAMLEEPEAEPVLFSDVTAILKRPRFFNRSYTATDVVYVAVMMAMHGLALLAPFTFSWANVGLFFASYFVTGCLGITLSFHRQLSHRRHVLSLLSLTLFADSLVRHTVALTCSW
jgi:stearoyl-CoA desaturase (Delta-9 desaturase)